MTLLAFFCNFNQRLSKIKTKNMTLAAKKQTLMKRFASLEDEKIIDDIIALLPKKELSGRDLAMKYAGKAYTPVDLEKLKKEQNFQGLQIAEMQKLSDDLDIQEDIEELLEMLD